MDPVQLHFHNWFAVALFILIYGVFVAFIPFYRKSRVKPGAAYLAFVVAFVLEMFGLPLSMYVLAWFLGHKLPDGILWGHTLNSYIGVDGGFYAGLAISLAGLTLVIVGWHAIHKHYWRMAEGQGQLVTSGIYRYIRNPQYTGFLLITLGMMCEWATITLLVMWPVLVWIYYRLAKREERDMGAEFGDAFIEYRERTGMFLPRLFRKPAGAAASSPRSGGETRGSAAVAEASGTVVRASSNSEA